MGSFPVFMIKYSERQLCRTVHRHADIFRRFQAEHPWKECYSQPCADKAMCCFNTAAVSDLIRVMSLQDFFLKSRNGQRCIKRAACYDGTIFHILKGYRWLYCEWMFCQISYPKTERKKFVLADAFYKPAIPFMLNMIFIMIPFGAVIAYSSILAQEKGLSSVIPFFYIFLVAGMLLSKFSTQKLIDSGRHAILVVFSLIVLFFTMGSYLFLNTAVHLLAAGFFLGIGIGSLLMDMFQESIGLSAGFAITAVAYIIGGVIYAFYVDRYYARLALRLKGQNLL